MSSQTPTPRSFDLESVKVWYSCRKRGVNCSAWFYSVPALQKHFEEKHPGVELKLPDHLSPEVMQGQIIFWEDVQPILRWPHAVVEIEATEPQQGPSKTTQAKQKINCAVCTKRFKSWSTLNFHVKREHLNPTHAPSQKVNNPGGETDKKSCQAVPTGQDKLQSSQMDSNSRKGIKIKRSSTSSSTTRKFCCPHSSKSFGFDYNLRRHLVSHSGVRPYQCTKCGVSSSLMQSFVKHLQLVHNLSEEDVKTMALEAGLKFLNTKKNIPLDRIDHSRINLAVIASIVETTDFQQVSNSVPVANKGKAKARDRKKKRKMTTCPHCPYETTIATRINDHLQLHKEGFKAAVCDLCGWFCHPGPRGLPKHRAVRHPEAAITSVLYNN